MLAARDAKGNQVVDPQRFPDGFSVCVQRLCVCVRVHLRTQGPRVRVWRWRARQPMQFTGPPSPLGSQEQRARVVLVHSTVFDNGACVVLCRVWPVVERCRRR